MMEESVLVALLALPGAAVLLLGIALWGKIGRSETLFYRVTSIALVGSILSGVALAVLLASSGSDQITAHIGEWFSVGHYEFHWVLIADKLSLPFALFCAILIGLIGAFSRRYLHKESGYFRFYFLLALFGAGVELIVLAGSLDLFFIGWEIVGLTSALLIAFFHERRKPVEHGLRAFITYRICDIGLLAATIWLHHSVGSSHFVAADGASFSGIPVPSSGVDTAFIGLLLLWATLGKSAQVPFGGWLPRAMEGPTPSSAIFYGAISVHLGAFLLLRAAPIIEASRVVQVAVISIGVLTAIHATFVGRAQSDIKSVLAYASMTQVGIIFVEIGFGLRYLALAHIIGHAAMRSLQILRSPSLLHDHHKLEQSLGGVLPPTGGHLERLIPNSIQPWLYRHALERGYFDAIIQDWILGSLVRMVRYIDALDQRWTGWLAGTKSASVAVKSRKHIP